MTESLEMALQTVREQRAELMRLQKVQADLWERLQDVKKKIVEKKARIAVLVDHCERMSSEEQENE